MNLTIKTLKGGKFVVEVEASNKIGEVKKIVETAKPEFPSANMKLIHSGKILKDDVTVEACNIKPTDFLVCMVTKAKKVAAAPAPATPAPVTPAPATPAPAAENAVPMETSSSTPAPNPPAAAAPSTESEAAAASTAIETSSSSSTANNTSAAEPSTSSDADEFPAEVVSNLVSMGFREAEVRACLRASSG